MTELILIAHNLRSSHNVGSLLRTAEGLGVDQVYLTGYTPYPTAKNDPRMPHLSAKINRQIEKTALGAEITQAWRHIEQIEPLVNDLKHQGYTVAALEQTKSAVELPAYTPPEKLAIIVGREVEGVELEVLALTDLQLVIPMFGSKESYNVVQAAAMALYHCKFA